MLGLHRVLWPLSGGGWNLVVLICVVIVSLGSGAPETLLAVCVTRASFFTSLSLSFLLCKMRVVTVSLLQGCGEDQIDSTGEMLSLVTSTQ